MWRALRAGAGMLALGVGLLGAAPTAAGQTAEPEEYAARSIARIAMLDLRARVHPTPDDYLVAASVLDAARMFAPNDPELLRGRIRAAWAAGEPDALESLTRELVRLDPRDTVAQLRLASARIGTIQTVEGRLKAYDRLIGSAGASIDPSVRSRLALDAALLCRENNNFAGFADRLAVSLQLDMTNKDAASLAWQMFAPMMETPSERLELLLSLLMADPTDPNVHRSIANELAVQGAFVEAQRFHNLSLTLYTQADSPVSDQLVMESAVLRWQIEGPEAVVKTLNEQLGLMRQQAAMQIQSYQEARMPIDSLPKPQEILLSPQYNHMRLVAALMADDKPTIAASLADMQNAFDGMVETYNKRAQLSTQEELARSTMVLWTTMAQQLVAVAWSNTQDESMREWTERIRTSLPPGSDVVRVLDAWTELRLGDRAVARDLFAALDPSSPLNRIGLALAEEELGNVEAAHQIYRELASEMPFALSGVWARARVRDATGIDPLETPTKAAMARLASDVPGWVDRMVADPRTFMGISATLERSSLGATERPTLRIRLTNLAPIPLGVGGDRPINTRLMLSPRVQAGLYDDFVRASAEVVELDHRLRLKPGETMTVDVWPDAGMVGWMAEVSAAETVRQRWRVLQGYRLNAAGVPKAGVLCLETETGRLVRAPLRLARATGLELADALDAAGTSQMVEVLAAVRARVLEPAGSKHALTNDEVQRLAAIAADRYTSLQPLARATMLAVLPPRSAVPGMAAFDRVAVQERDPTLVPLALTTRVTDPGDPVLQEWLESDSERLATVARAMQTRLGSPKPTFARLGAGVLGPIGPTAAESAAGSGR